MVDRASAFVLIRAQRSGKLGSSGDMREGGQVSGYDTYRRQESIGGRLGVGHDRRANASSYVRTFLAGGTRACTSNAHLIQEVHLCNLEGDHAVAVAAAAALSPVHIFDMQTELALLQKVQHADDSTAIVPALPN